MNIPDSPPPAQLPAMPQASFIDSRQSAGWTAGRQRRFCEVLAETGRVEVAANAAGMTRDSAYKLRSRASGSAFAMAWDAALLMARQRLIDEAMELAFEGSVEQIFRDGKVIGERRKRDARSLLVTVERLGRPSALGSKLNQTIAQEFDHFLDCIEVDAETLNDPDASGCEAASFLKHHSDWSGSQLPPIEQARMTLSRNRLQHREAMAHQAVSES